jgi:hypothetical protein
MEGLGAVFANGADRAGRFCDLRDGTFNVLS